MELWAGCIHVAINVAAVCSL